VGFGALGEDDLLWGEGEVHAGDGHGVGPWGLGFGT
jgi:hypothetical protein